MSLNTTFYFSLNLFRCEKSFPTIIFLVLLTVSLFFSSQELFSQTQDNRISKVLIETGIGYPFSLTNQKQYFDAHLNIGLTKKFNRYYSGFLFGGHYRQSFTSDNSISSKFRIGKLIMPKNNISIDIGYSLYSKKYKYFPGFTFGLNFEKTNEYGIHLRFDEFSGNEKITEKNIILGLHVSDDKASKIALPIIGGTILAAVIITLVISGSR